MSSNHEITHRRAGCGLKNNKMHSVSEHLLRSKKATLGLQLYLSLLTDGDTFLYLPCMYLISSYVCVCVCVYS